MTHTAYVNHLQVLTTSCMQINYVAKSSECITGQQLYDYYISVHVYGYLK